MIIELIGYPASGKTFIANIIAKKYDTDCIDIEYNKLTKFKKIIFILKKSYLFFSFYFLELFFYIFKGFKI